MKRDELNLLTGIAQDMHPKRRGYILGKWLRRGWWLRNQLTPEGNRIRGLALDKHHHSALEGRVVMVEFVQEDWGYDQAIGILKDTGDYGWDLHTSKSIVHNSCHMLGTISWSNSIAYIDRHPSPAKIWEKMNRLYWKKHKIPDRFHQKINWMTPGAVTDYSRASEGIYTGTHPLGRIGDCFPFCQCRHL